MFYMLTNSLSACTINAFQINIKERSVFQI